MAVALKASVALILVSTSIVPARRRRSVSDHQRDNVLSEAARNYQLNIFACYQFRPHKNAPEDRVSLRLTMIPPHSSCQRRPCNSACHSRSPHRSARPGIVCQRLKMSQQHSICPRRRRRLAYHLRRPRRSTRPDMVFLFQRLATIRQGRSFLRRQRKVNTMLPQQKNSCQRCKVSKMLSQQRERVCQPGTSCTRCYC